MENKYYNIPPGGQTENEVRMSALRGILLFISFLGPIGLRIYPILIFEFFRKIAGVIEAGHKADIRHAFFCG